MSTFFEAMHRYEIFQHQLDLVNGIGANIPSYVPPPACLRLSEIGAQLPWLTQIAETVNSVNLPELGPTFQAVSLLYDIGTSIPQTPISTLFADIYRFPAVEFMDTAREGLSRYGEVILRELYDAKWLPYIGYDMPGPCLSGINDILLHTKKSKNRVKKIDAFVFSYYGEEYLKYLRTIWMDIDCLPIGTRRVLADALRAYRRREYSVPALMLPMFWEEILKIKSPKLQEIIEDRKGKGKNERKREAFLELIAGNNYSEIIVDFHQEYIAYQCYGIEEIKEDVPGRNPAAHGWVNKYPSRKAALNAILFTDFLLELDSIAEMASAG